MTWVCENDNKRINMTLCHLHGGWMEVDIDNGVEVKMRDGGLQRFCMWEKGGQCLKNSPHFDNSDVAGSL
jgi:hypothetical protein